MSNGSYPRSVGRWRTHHSTSFRPPRRSRQVMVITPGSAIIPQKNGLAPVLPFNVEAECAVLGAILLDNHALDAALEKLRSEDFFLSQHRLIFQSMIQLGEKQQAIDTVTLMEELGRRGELEAAGGIAYLSTLANGLPKATNVEYYARIVKGKAHLRSLAFSAAAIQEQALAAEDDAAVILDRAESMFHAIREDARSTDWKMKFHTVAELPDGDVCFLIDGILPEGVTFIGASSGVGKTWFALSMSRALITGAKFLGVWNVPESCNVLYLCPEMQSRPFKKRCTRLGIVGERFRCQTVSDGAPLDLANPALLAAVHDLRPVIFLDTSIRFSSAESENSATDNQPLMRAICSLIHAGAKAVICLHHRSKDSARADEMTLENVLRGTGDLGAVADCVLGLRYDQLGGNVPYLRESRKLVRLQVRCVKSRDFCPVEDFRVQLEPFLDERGDFAVVTDELEPQESEGQRLSKAIAANPTVTKIQLQTITGIGRNRIGKLAAAEGWEHKPFDGWVKT